MLRQRQGGKEEATEEARKERSKGGGITDIPVYWDIKGQCPPPEY